MLKTCVAVTALVAFAASATAGQGLDGRWKTAAGTTAEIAPCADGHCITLKTGKFAGRTIGKMKAADDRYEGTITDPSDDKTYVGNAVVGGDKLKLQGCVFKVFCRTQTWTRLP
ncbi:MAG: DUF2147 domain-containing protein [Asticcacaulis sp.]|nr:DUF2147 domain-containing protein [Asticcacaulis sp.]